MRTQVLNKKLSLNKATVANLTQFQMRLINGGLADVNAHPKKGMFEKDVDSTYTYHTCKPWTCGCVYPNQDAE